MRDSESDPDPTYPNGQIQHGPDPPALVCERPDRLEKNFSKCSLDVTVRLLEIFKEYFMSRFKSALLQMKFIMNVLSSSIVVDPSSSYNF